MSAPETMETIQVWMNIDPRTQESEVKPVVLNLIRELERRRPQIAKQ